MKHAEQTQLSEQDYLEGERANPIRHEYVAGEVFAMAGDSKAHNIIPLNIATLLRSKLRGSGCQTFIADMRVRIAAQSSYYYPDVVVTCASTDMASDALKDHIESPSLTVEVLSGVVAASAALQPLPAPCGCSPTTEAIDRREKMLAHRNIETLREYVLVDPERRWLEVYRRIDSGWAADLYSPEDTVTLNPATPGAAGLSFGMDEVYEGSGVV